MKSIKLAVILLVGQCVFNPLAVLSQFNGGNVGATVSYEGNEYSCYALERAGNYFKKGFNVKCARVGYVRQADYPPTQDDLIDLRIELVKKANEVRALCTKLSQGMGSTDPEIINGCAEVGIGVDATNLD